MAAGLAQPSLASRPFPPGLVQPSHWYCPPYVKTWGPEVCDAAADLDFPPDGEQEEFVNGVFAIRDDSSPVAFEAGLVVGRQNMKTGSFKICIIGWVFVTDVRLVIFTAHEEDTVKETHRDLEDLITSKRKYSREIKSVTHGKGSLQIELKSGQRVKFKPRTKGGGRGLTGDKVVLDEAYAAEEAHMGALVPTLSTRKGAQIIYGSAAGMADSDVLRDVRDRGRAGMSRRLLWMEYGCPPPEVTCDAGVRCTHAKTAVGCGCDKPRWWFVSNPTLGKRLSVEYVEAERQALPVLEFCRERMGWWEEQLIGTVPIPVVLWTQCADKKSRIATGSPLAVGLDVAPDSSFSSIALAGWRDDGLPHGELVEHLPGTGWVVDRLVGICDRRKPVIVMLDPSSPAGAMEKELRNRGFETHPVDKPPPLMKQGHHRMHLLSSRDNAQACGALKNAVTEGKFRHPDQEPLNTAIQNARSRTLGQAWAWDPAADADTDITPVPAVTFAHHGLVMFGQKEVPLPFLVVGDKVISVDKPADPEDSTYGKVL